MKTKTLFLSSLVAAAAMSTVPAFADYTWNTSNTTITQDLWQTESSWTLSGSSSWPSSGTGPGTPNSNAWDKIVIAGTSDTKVSGSIDTLEGWALKLELTNADLTVGQLKKFQVESGGCSISLDKDSVFTVSNFSGGNDGGSVTLTNEGTFNLTLGKGQAGDGFKADLGSTGVFNISGAYSAKITTLSAKLGNGSSDYVSNIINGNTIYTRNLVNLSGSATLENTATYSFTDKDDNTLSAVDSLASLTGTDQYFVVKDSSGYRVSYLVSGVSDQVYSWNASANSSWSDAVWKNGESTGQSITNEGVAYLGDEGTSKAITISSATTAARLIVDGDYTLSGNGSLTMTNGGIINSGKTLTLATEAGANGFLRGALEVAGTLQLNAKDITGYNGGTTSLHTITVDAGGVLKLNHSSNETFAGTLTLNGTLSGKDSDTRWDMYGSSSQINVAENASAVIDENIRVIIRRSNAPINVGTGATLTIDGQVLKSSEAGQQLGGNGVLVKNGAGELKLNGKVVLEQLTVNAGKATISGTETKTTGKLVNYGTTTVGSGTTLNITGSGTGTNGSMNWNTFVVEDGGTANFTADFRASAWSTSSAGVKTLTVGENATLNVGGVMYNASGLTLTNKGLITAGTIDYSSGNGWGTNTVSGNGYIVAGTFNVGNQTQFVLQNNTYVWGALTFEKSGDVRFGNATIGAKNDWSTSKNVALTGTVGTEATTTVFNTGKFDTTSKAFSTTEGYTITLNGDLSGAGGLTKAGAGTLKLSGTNTFEGDVTISAGTLVAANASALGKGTTTVESGAKLGLVAKVTVADVAGGITLAEGAKIVIDMSNISETESFTLDLITGTELTYGTTSITSDNVNKTLENVIEFSGWGESLTDWTQELKFDDSSKKLSLSLTKIPEPSAFGLLAGVGALVFVAARRRRRAK